MSSHAPHALPSGASPSPSHLPALDGLRGLAILLVLAHNFATVPMPADALGRSLEWVLDLGWIGVQLFFVLSGFLITRILLRTQDSPDYYRSFFGRRVLRIFPLYYGTLFVAFVVLPMLGATGPALAHDQPHQAWLWLYLSNWTQLLHFESRLFPHFWSLAIEEQFYLLWPFFVHRRSAGQVLAAGLLLATASLGLRILMLWQGASADAVYTYTFCRMDALALGAAAAAWMQLPQARAGIRIRPHALAGAALAVWMAGAAVTHGYPRTSMLGQTLGYSLLAVVFSMLVLAASVEGEAAASAWWGRALKAKFLRTLGKYSYAMYVLHKPLHDFIGRPLMEHHGLLKASHGVALAYVALATAATLAAGVLSYHLFEKHFLALKRFFVAAPSGALSARAADPARRA